MNAKEYIKSDEFTVEGFIEKFPLARLTPKAILEILDKDLETYIDRWFTVFDIRIAEDERRLAINYLIKELGEEKFNAIAQEIGLNLNHVVQFWK